METCSISKIISTEEPSIFRKKILDWYDEHGRALPWRSLSGEIPDPYRVWLSEVMLQQTTVTAVIPYFLKFTKKWPHVHALASAESDEVMSNWAGLGYYARARNLHKCAQIVSRDYGGIFPQDQNELKKLPGIGDYTSAAITSIAFDTPANVVDGNVERVMARYYACDVPLPEGKKKLKKYAHTNIDGFSKRAGDYAQGLMDLGATICTPKSPVCSLCPLSQSCLGYTRGEPKNFPLRSMMRERPKKYGYVYWITNNNGNVLVYKRPEKGLLGGMYGLPTSDWLENKEKLVHIDFLNGERCKLHKPYVTHVFTHFHLTLIVYSTTNLDKPYLYLEDRKWIRPDLFMDFGMPTVFKKAAKFFI